MVGEVVGTPMPALPKDLKRSYHKLGPVIAIVDWMLEEVAGLDKAGPQARISDPGYNYYYEFVQLGITEYS